jgi:3-hydroxyacyl-CoA dehydrogenase
MRGGAVTTIGQAAAKPGATVIVRREGEIAHVIINRPPVNALNAETRAQLAECLQKLDVDQDVEGIVVSGAGRGFVAGADIAEFDRSPAEPTLRDCVALVEGLGKPTVAAIHGNALGGGLELAMACTFRVSDHAARFGMPEVKLGLIPGSGGTVRLPRLIGWRRAVEMIVTGEPVPPQEALELGLIDAVFEDDLLEQSAAFLRARMRRGPVPPRVRDRTEKLAGASEDALSAAAAPLLRKAKGIEAAAAAVVAVGNAVTLDFDTALARERQLFEQLRKGDQSRALRHLFFAERQAARPPQAVAPENLRQIAEIGVVGAGTMGGGITMAFANAGLPVTLIERDEETLAAGLARIEANYRKSVERGSLSEVEMTKRLSRIDGSIDFAKLAASDLIVEAAFEEMSVKIEILGRLDRIAKADAILATNTSYLDVDAIAAATGRPENVLGMHFFSPANVMKLVEVVRGAKTAPATIASVLAVAKTIGKVPVVVGVCRGFVGNRMLGARNAELENLLIEGAQPADVDEAFRQFGWPMGPFQMSDLAGLDISWRNRRALGRKLAIADQLCEQGHFGQKTGRGYYRYPKGSRRPLPDPDVEALVLAASAGAGIARRAISAEEIIERTHLPLVNEGMRILEEGIAARPSDIDVIWVHGYGFPRVKGGPMFWAEQQGFAEIAKRMEYWRDRTGKTIFEPSSRLRNQGIRSQE